MSNVMLKQMIEKVLVVGTGLTGASTAALLRQDFKETVAIHMWDKSRGIGGRMSTSRSNKDSNCTVDLGAQYITALPKYQQKHASQYDSLIQAGILKPLTASIEGHVDNEEGTKNYITPLGVSSIVKHFVTLADVKVGKEQLVRDVSIAADKVKVTTDQGQSELFDAVILTMPVPQILQLQGDVAQLIEQKGVRGDLEKVSYSSRFAVGIFYGAGTVLNLPWSAKYVMDHPCIRFISLDNEKRGLDSKDIGPSICVHTSVPWSLKNLEMDKEDAAKQIMEYVKELLPGLPEPAEVKGHKWRYSQVHKGFPGSPGCVVLNDKPSIILAGDAFVERPAFDGCVESSLTVQEKINSLWRKNGNL